MNETLSFTLHSLQATEKDPDLRDIKNLLQAHFGKADLNHQARVLELEEELSRVKKELERKTLEAGELRARLVRQAQIQNPIGHGATPSSKRSDRLSQLSSIENVSPVVLTAKRGQDSRALAGPGEEEDELSRLIHELEEEKSSIEAQLARMEEGLGRQAAQKEQLYQQLRQEQLKLMEVIRQTREHQSSFASQSRLRQQIVRQAIGISRRELR